MKKAKLAPTVAVLGEPADTPARSLASDLDLPLVTTATARDADFLLVPTARGLEIRWSRAAAPGPVRVDFLTGPTARRWRQPGKGRPPLARALGLAGEQLWIVDATAGLGRDAFVMAALGCRVTAIERQPVLAALLADGLRRARADPNTAPIAARITLLVGDGQDELVGLEPDVVYLDPMLAEPREKARVKKDLQLLRELVGPDPDAAELLIQARARARLRVAVKRPLRAPPLAADPDGVVQTTRTRFDIYLTR